MPHFKKVLAIAFYISLVFATIILGAELYFGFATFKTTILLYVLLGVGGIALINLLNKKFNAGINPNIKILIVTVAVSLLTGEYALRYVFKRNLTYLEKLSGAYISSYSYLYDWNGIKRYIFDKHNYWYLKGNAKDSFISLLDGRAIKHKYNSLGFREDEVTPQTDDPGHLVIGLGDSFTEGIGTPYDSTWLKFLERNLNTDSTCNIRTYNAGAQGSDVFFEYLVLEQLLQQYHPNTVVLGINSSDVDDIIIKGGRNRFKPNGGLQFNSPPWWERLYGASFIIRAMIHAGNNYDWTLLTQEEKKIKQQRAIDSIEYSVHRFQALAKQQNFNLVVAFHPRENEITEYGFPLDSLADKLAADTDLNVVNLNRRFAQTGLITKSNAAAYYWKYDLHHNAAGYKIMADLIADFIRSKELACTAKK